MVLGPAAWVCVRGWQEGPQRSVLTELLSFPCTLGSSETSSPNPTEGLPAAKWEAAFRKPKSKVMSANWHMPCPSEPQFPHLAKRLLTSAVQASCEQQEVRRRALQTQLVHTSVIGTSVPRRSHVCPASALVWAARPASVPASPFPVL